MNVSRRNFLKGLGAAIGANAKKQAVQTVVSPVAKPIQAIKQAGAIYKDASAAGDINKLANGANIIRTRRSFLKAARKRGAGWAG